MNKTEYDQYMTCKPAAAPMLSIDDIGHTERTLAYGYTCDRETWHAYVKGSELHVVVYRNNYNDQTKPPAIVSYTHGRELPIETLRPDKRVYPHATDVAFAHLMRNRQMPLPFARFDENANVDSNATFIGHIA